MGMQSSPQSAELVLALLVCKHSVSNEEATLGRYTSSVSWYILYCKFLITIIIII